MFNLSNVIRDVSQCNKILFYLIEKKKTFIKVRYANTCSV